MSASLAPQLRTQWQEEAVRHQLLALSAVFVIMTLGCDPSATPLQSGAGSSIPTAASDTVRVTSDSPIEAKLAALELGGQGPEQVVATSLVSDFDRVLARLDGVCLQNRVQLADMGVLAVQQLGQGGRTMGYMEWFSGVDSLLVAANAPEDDSTDCTVVFASALTAL